MEQKRTLLVVIATLWGLLFYNYLSVMSDPFRYGIGTAVSPGKVIGEHLSLGTAVSAVIALLWALVPKIGKRLPASSKHPAEHSSAIENHARPARSTDYETWMREFCVPQTRIRRKHLSVQQCMQMVQAANHVHLAALGADHKLREVNLERQFEEAKSSRTAAYGVVYQSDAFMFFECTRSLAVMDSREKVYLLIAELLNSIANGEEDAFIAWRASLIYGDGKAIINRWQSSIGGPGGSVTERATHAMQTAQLTVEQTMSAMQQYFETLRSGAETPPVLQDIVTRANERTFSGSAWLRHDTIHG